MAQNNLKIIESFVQFALFPCLLLLVSFPSFAYHGTPKEQRSCVINTPFDTEPWSARNNLLYQLGNTLQPFSGVSSCVHKINDMPHSKGEIDTGRRVGQWTYWHDDGTKWKEGGYQDGKKDGVWLEWYYGGQLKSEQPYKASIITPSLEESWIRHGIDPKEGSVNTWHKNGEKNYQGAYLDGKRHGKWTYWDLNGNKTAERYYKKGKISQEVNLDKDETTLGVIEKTNSVNKDDQPGATSGFFEGVTAVVKWLFTPTL